MIKEYIDAPCFGVTKLGVQFINLDLHLSVAMFQLLFHVTSAVCFYRQLPNPTLEVSYHP